MKFTKKLLATLLVAVMLVSSVVSAGLMVGMEADALSAVGCNTEFQLTKANYTFGCDISSYNVLGETLAYSRVDFAKMKADGCDFVILRIGQTKSADHKQYIDMAFLEYYKRARAAGMKLGVYFYSRARTAAEAKTEANWVINIIETNNMYFEYPIYFDVEAQEQMGGTNPSGKYYSALSNSALETMTLSFMETMEAAGYYPALYCMKSAFEKYSSSFKAKYDLWGAHVKNGEGTAESNLKYEDPYEYDYSTVWGMWQYSWYGHKKFNGYTYDSQYKQLDVNICYKDYPTLMAKYGYNNCISAGNNLAHGATVTTFEVKDGARANVNMTTRGYTGKLTDGKASQVGPFDTANGGSTSEWFGFFRNEEVPAEENCSTGLGHIMVNLGSAKTVGSIKVNVSNTEGTAPAKLTAYVGTSEYSLTEVGTMIMPNTGYGWAVINLPTPTSIQFIRIDVSMTGHWALLNEIQAFAEKDDSAVPPAPGPVVSVDKVDHIAVGSTVTDKYNSAPLVSASSGCKFGGTSVLTDGKVSSAVTLTDSAWYTIQRYHNANDPEQGIGELTLDLGATYSIGSVRLHLANVQMDAPTAGYFVSAHGPDAIKISLLAEDKSVVATGNITPNNTTEIVYWSDAYNANGAEARYIVVEIEVGGTLANDDYYALLDEIAVYGVIKEDDNLAYGKTVTTAPDAVREYTASLTDGVVAEKLAPGENNAEWYAIFTNADATDQNCPTGVAEIVIDLGAKYDLSEIKVHIGTCAGVYAPLAVVASVAVKENGTYTNIGELSGSTETDGTYWISVDATGTVGRYLKLTVSVDTKTEYSYYAMMNEVKAYGTVNTSSDRFRGDVNNDGVVDKKDYAVLKRYCFDATNLDEDSRLAADVNNDGVVDKKDYAVLKRFCFDAGVIENPYI